MRPQLDQLHIAWHTHADVLQLVRLRDAAAQETPPRNADAPARQLLQRARRIRRPPNPVDPHQSITKRLEHPVP